MPSGLSASESLCPHDEGSKLKGQNEAQNDVKDEEEEQRVMERNWIRPDQPSKCTWHLGVPNTDSPHVHAEQ